MQYLTAVAQFTCSGHTNDPIFRQLEAEYKRMMAQEDDHHTEHCSFEECSSPS